MNAKRKVVHGRGPSKINLGIFVCSFDVCGLNYVASDFHQSNSGTLSGILVGRNGSTLGKNVGNNDDSFEKVNIELPSEEGTQTFEQPAQKSKLVIYCKLLHEINLQMYSTGIQTS